ncbi:MAG: rhodanese-like domain-containing protein, partial [Pseudomonadota bacterium]
MAFSSAVALLVNAARPGGIALIEKKEYEIFVPCPEPVGEVTKMSPVDFLALKRKKVLVIDARYGEDYDQWHYPQAMNVTFDYLEPVCRLSLKEIASSGASMV